MAGVNITYYTKDGERTIKIVNLPKIWMDKPDVSFITSLRVAGLAEDLTNNIDEDLLEDADALNGHNYMKTMNKQYNKELNKYKRWYAGQLTVEQEPVVSNVSVVVGLDIAGKLRVLPDNKFLDVSDLKNIKTVLSTKNKFKGDRSKLTSGNYKNFYNAICSIPNGMVRYADDIRNAKNYFNIDIEQAQVLDTCMVGSTIDAGVPIRSIKTDAKRNADLKEKKEQDEARAKKRQIEREKEIIDVVVNNNDDDVSEEEPRKETMKEKTLRLKKEKETPPIKESMKEKMLRLKKEKDTKNENVLEGVDIFDFDTYKKEFDLMSEYYDGLELYLRTALFIDYKYNHLNEENKNIVEDTLKKKKNKKEYLESLFDVFEPIYLLTHWFNHFAPEKLDDPNHMQKLIDRYQGHIDGLFNKAYKNRVDKSWDVNHKLWFSENNNVNEEEEKIEEVSSESEEHENVVRKTNKKKPVKEKKVVKPRPFRLVLNTIKKGFIDVSNIDPKGFGINVVSRKIDDYFSVDDLPIISDNYKGFKQAIKLIDNGPIKYKRDLDKARLFFGLAYVDVSTAGDDVNNVKVIKPKDLTDDYFYNDKIVSNNYKNMYDFYEHNDIIDQFNMDEALAFFQVNEIDNFKLMVNDVSKNKVIDVSDILNNYNVTEGRKSKIPKNMYVSINQPIASDNLLGFLYASSLLDDVKGHKGVDIEQATLFYENKYWDVSKEPPTVVDEDNDCIDCFYATKLRVLSDNYDGFYTFAKDYGYLELLKDDIILAKEYFNISKSEDSDES